MDSRLLNAATNELPPAPSQPSGVKIHTYSQNLRKGSLEIFFLSLKISLTVNEPPNMAYTVMGSGALSTLPC